MYKDALWVKQILSGDGKAFHHLIRKYQTAIYALILSQVESPDDARELTQDVFLKAYQKLPSLRQPESFSLWLRQIARNHCHDWQRGIEEPSAPLLANMPVETPPVDEEMVLRETISRVMQAVDELPPIEGQLLRERYLDDSSYADLQARHGLSYKAVTMRILRARRKVRERVEKLFSGVAAFPWHKVLMGGMEAVKMGIKTKLAVIGISALLVFGGALIWHYHQSPQAVPNSEAAVQKPVETSVVTPVLSRRSSDSVADGYSKTSQEEQEDENLTKNQAEELLLWLDSLETEDQAQSVAQSGNEPTDDPKQQEIQDAAAKLERQQAVEAVRQKITGLILEKGEVENWDERYRAMSDEERQRVSPITAERYIIARREIGQMIMVAIMEYYRLTGDRAATYPGGWIYELGQQNGFRIRHE